MDTFKVKFKVDSCKDDMGKDITDKVQMLRMVSAWFAQNTQTEVEVFDENEPDIILGTITIEPEYEVALQQKD
jgi:hypothetical protein